MKNYNFKSIEEIKNKKITTKIIIFSFLFIYIPTIIIGIIFVLLIRLEDIESNKLIVEKSVEIFEALIYEKKIEYYVITKYIANEDKIQKCIKEKNIKELTDFLIKNKKEQNFSALYIYDENCNILNTSNNNPLITECYDKQKSFIYFNNNIIIFENVIPVKIENKTYYVFSRYNLLNNQIKNSFIVGLNFIILNKYDNKVVFSTNENNNCNGKELTFNFKNLPELKNYIIKVNVSQKLYRIRLDKILLILFLLFIIWIISISLYNMLLDKSLVAPLKIILKGASEFARGDLSHRIIINHKNEIGLLADKLNSLASSLQKKQEELDLVNKDLENKVIQRTKSLQKALDKLREYDNQKTDLFYSIVHDLKNPLTIIQGYASMIIQYDNFSIEKKKEFLKKIVSETERLTKMLNDFLQAIRDESNLSKMEFSEIDITHILEYFYIIYEIKAKEMNINFIWNVEKNLPKIIGNSDKLENVVSNLLSNAFKFVNANGTIIISATQENGFVKVGVENTGPQIEKSKQKEIFGKFKKISQLTNKNQSGAGLGLYIAQQIVQKHNGEIWVENNKGGNGTIFYFTVPIKKYDDFRRKN